MVVHRLKIALKNLARCKTKLNDLFFGEIKIFSFHVLNSLFVSVVGHFANFKTLAVGLDKISRNHVLSGQVGRIVVQSVVFFGKYIRIGLPIHRPNPINNIHSTAK